MTGNENTTTEACENSKVTATALDGQGNCDHKYLEIGNVMS